MWHRHRGVVIAACLVACGLPVLVRGQAIQEAEFLAPDGHASDWFGLSIAVSGDTAVVGASGTDNGTVYVFVRSGPTWTQQAKLTASGGQFGDAFGSSVALAGDVLVVGARGEDAPGLTDVGAAYVFVRTGTTWKLQAKLSAGVPAKYDGLGSSVAFSGATVLVGGDQFDVDDFRLSGPGLAYVFVRSGTTWAQQAKLTASDAANGDWFGHSVALEGDTAVIGAMGADPSGSTLAGAAYVFARAGTSWTQAAKLQASDMAAYDEFGGSVALKGDTALIGAVIGGGSEGAAYVFTGGGTAWTQQAKLTASDASGSTSANQFGTAVALEGDTCVVGAPFDSQASGLAAGSAYVFSRTGSVWSQRAKLTASDASQFDFFGTAVALSGSTATVGAYGHDAVAGTDAGSAYSFRVLTSAFGAWLDAGQALAGTNGLPRLAGSGDLLPGAMAQLTLTSAKPGSMATVVIGLTALKAPFKGGVLVPDADLLVVALPIDLAGKLALSSTWPAGLPSLWSTWYQAWIQDAAGPKGLAASNAVQSTTP